MTNLIQKWIAVPILILVVICSGILMFSSSSRDSAIMDELAHIPSGYGYAKHLDYRLNPEHPPLIKFLSAIPLLFTDLKFPTDQSYWQKDVNGQWDVGNQFIYKINGDKADLILQLSRIFPIILTLILIIFVFIWSKELMGPLWALLPSFLVALSPNILAHGHYVTTDIGAALGFFGALYFFVKYFNQPTNKNLVFAGIFFGIAQLMKFSTVLLIPLFIFLALAYLIAKIKERGQNIISKDFLKILWQYTKVIFFIFLIGFVLVWIVYVIFTLNYPIEKQVSDTKTILGSFSPKIIADVNIWLSSKPILRGIGEYMLGVLMVFQRSSGGNTAYFLGEVSAGGWWYYFPVIFILKEPIPSLVILVLGLIFFASRFIKKDGRSKERFINYILLNFAEFSMLCLIILYWVYSMKSPLNIGFRHILPTIPFIYILSVGSFKKTFGNISQKIEYIGLNKILEKIKGLLMSSLKFIIIGILCIWLFIETIICYPYFLSYFNEFGNGTFGGYHHATDSNYDWGQDLKALGEFVEENKIEKIAIDYFGGSDVSYYLKNKGIGWQSSNGNPKKEKINWLAVSIFSLQQAKGKPIDGFIIKPKDSYYWIENYEEPYARIGTTIFVYKLQ